MIVPRAFDASQLLLLYVELLRASLWGKARTPDMHHVAQTACICMQDFYRIPAAVEPKYTTEVNDLWIYLLIP